MCQFIPRRDRSTAFLHENFLHEKLFPNPNASIGFQEIRPRSVDYT